MRITGKEKAVVGGLGAGITTLAGQLQVGGKFSVSVVAWSVAAWLATHIFVYATTNTPLTEDAEEEVITPPVAPTA